jgi:hypothetical protein
VEVRRYTAGFLHGKAFIVDTALPHVMSGSSNGFVALGGKQTSFPLCCLDQMARASSVKITVS